MVRLALNIWGAVASILYYTIGPLVVTYRRIYLTLQKYQIILLLIVFIPYRLVIDKLFKFRFYFIHGYELL